MIDLNIELDVYPQKKHKVKIKNKNKSLSKMKCRTKKFKIHSYLIEVVYSYLFFF